MSRKFNFKKFIKDVLNDRYSHLQTTIKSVVEVINWSSFGTVKEKASTTRRILSCCVNKLRNSLEYAYNMSVVL